MARCRISNEKLDTIIDLGNIYLSDFLKKENSKAPKGKLRIGFGKKSKNDEKNILSMFSSN